MNPARTLSLSLLGLVVATVASFPVVLSFLSPVPLAAVMIAAYVSLGFALLGSDYVYLLFEETRSSLADPQLSQKRFVEQLLSKTLQKHSIFTTTRAVLVLCLTNALAVLAWPINLFHGFRLLLHGLNISFQTRGQALAMVSLSIRDVPLSLFCLVIASGLTFITILSNTLGVYERSIAILLLIAITARHLDYVLGFTTIHDRLKRSWGNPYTRFVLIAVADLMTLVFVYYILKTSDTGLRDPKDILGELGSFFKVFSIEYVLSIFTGNNDILSYLIFMSAFLYSAAGLKSVMGYKELARTDADNINMARSLLRVGRAREARQALDQITVRSPESLLTGVLVSARLGDFEEAEKVYNSLAETTNRFAEVKNPESAHNNRSLEFGGVIHISGVLGNQQFAKFFEYLVNRTSDVVLLSIARTAVLAAKQRRRLLKIVRDNNKEKALPLTASLLAAMNRELAQADSLLAAVKDGKQDERVALNILLLLRGILSARSEEEAAGAVVDWKGKYGTETESAYAKLENDLVKMSLLELAFLVGGASELEELGQEDAIMGLVRVLRLQVAENDITRKPLAVLDAQIEQIGGQVAVEKISKEGLVEA